MWRRDWRRSSPGPDVPGPVGSSGNEPDLGAVGVRFIDSAHAGATSFRRIGAFAGIAYVVLVAIENLDVLDLPTYDSTVAEVIEAYNSSEARLAITTVAGTLALFAYVVAAVALLVCCSHRGSAPWRSRRRGSPVRTLCGPSS